MLSPSLFENLILSLGKACSRHNIYFRLWCKFTGSWLVNISAYYWRIYQFVLFSFSSLYINSAVCQSTGLCSEQNRASNLQACLNAIGIAAIDPTQFWFGTDYYQRCPQGPLTPGFGCFLPKGFQIPESMSSLVFTPGTFDPVTLDRYIDITFTSPEGKCYK